MGKPEQGLPSTSGRPMPAGSAAAPSSPLSSPEVPTDGRSAVYPARMAVSAAAKVTSIMRSPFRRKSSSSSGTTETADTVSPLNGMRSSLEGSVSSGYASSVDDVASCSRSSNGGSRPGHAPQIAEEMRRENLRLRGQLLEFEESNVQLKEQQQQLDGENAQLKEEQQRLHGAAELRTAHYNGLVEKTDASTKAATLLEEQLRQAKAELSREAYDSVAWSKAEKAKTQKLQEQLQTALQDGAHSKAVLMEKEKAEDTLRKEKDEVKQRHEKEMDAMKKEVDATKKEMAAMKKEVATLRESNATLQIGKDELQQGKDRLQREKNALEPRPASPLGVSQPRGIAWLADP